MCLCPVLLEIMSNLWRYYTDLYRRCIYLCVWVGVGGGGGDDVTLLHFLVNKARSQAAEACVIASSGVMFEHSTTNRPGQRKL